MIYKFMSNSGNTVTVVTDNDEEAKPLAMQYLYGDCPREWVEWEGDGLILVECK